MLGIALSGVESLLKLHSERRALLPVYPELSCVALHARVRSVRLQTMSIVPATRGIFSSKFND